MGIKSQFHFTRELQSVGFQKGEGFNLVLAPMKRCSIFFYFFLRSGLRILQVRQCFRNLSFGGRVELWIVSDVTEHRISLELLGLRIVLTLEELGIYLDIF